MDFLYLFVTFFFANIASKYVAEYIDPHLSSIRDKKNFDKSLGRKVLSVCNFENINMCMNDISKGEVFRYKVWDLKELIRMYHTNKRFFDKKLQIAFTKLVASLEDLRDLMDVHFSLADHDDRMLWIHKYERAEDGHLLYEKIIRELGEISNEVVASANDFENALVKKFPKLAEEDLKQIILPRTVDSTETDV